MADTAQVVQRLRESRPPATDVFTYLTIVEKSLSPEILPDLYEILQDAELTADIGWDLVEMLIAVPGSDECLQAVAQLGNPREVILKVLEVLEKTAAEEEQLEDEDEKEADSDNVQDSPSTNKFITLVGMLGILHKRLEVKAPSRFLHTTLQTVYRCYDPRSAPMTAAVVDLARSLSGQKRPPLPTRKSSTTLTTPFQASDATKNAPDPEAEDVDRADTVEPRLQNRLLRAFVTAVIEAYVNSNSFEWAARLLEFYNPERIVPGRKPMMQMYKEISPLQAQDALVGQLASLAEDLGLYKLPPAAVKELLEAPLLKDSLSAEPDHEDPDSVKVSTAGFWCLTAYSVFASQVFDADYTPPNIHMFPDHADMLKRFLADDPQRQIAENVGTVDALLVLGLWLDRNGRITAQAQAPTNFMMYHHHLTLFSVFHPRLSTRNVATTLAGLVLHADPDDGDRLTVLEDLLENCSFASLQACAVTWLREELIIAQKRKLKNQFASAEAIERLQYVLFPNLEELRDADADGLLEQWVRDYPFHLQAANFAYFLFAGSDYKHLVPDGMGAAVEQRYVEPLLSAAKSLEVALADGKVDGQGMDGELTAQLGILTERLKSIPLQ